MHRRLLAKSPEDFGPNNCNGIDVPTQCVANAFSHPLHNPV
jgi:hypothetical protein